MGHGPLAPRFPPLIGNIMYIVKLAGTELIAFRMDSSNPAPVVRQRRVGQAVVRGRKSASI